MVRSPAQRKRTALASAIVLSAACVTSRPARGTPCIDTNTVAWLVTRTMTVQQAGRAEVPVTGTIASLDASTGEFGIKVFGIDSEQRIRDAVIGLQTLEPSMVAQMQLPVKTPFGKISTEFPLAALSVDRSVIRYPGCIEAEQGHEIAFNGTLTLGNGKLKIDGSFFDYALATDGAREPGITGGKRG